MSAVKDKHREMIRHLDQEISGLEASLKLARSAMEYHVQKAREDDAHRPDAANNHDQHRTSGAVMGLKGSNCHQAAAAILEMAGTPLTAREIFECAVRYGYEPKNPKNGATIFYTALARHPDLFQKAGEGRWQAVHR